MAKAQQPLLPQLLRDSAAALTPAGLRELSSYIEAQSAVKPDPRDSAHDKLFGALMARVDLLQAHRAAFLALIDRIQRQPQLLPVLLRNLGQSLTRLLDANKLLAEDARRHAQVAGLVTVSIATLWAWRNDTSTDLSATLRALDTNLRRAEKFAAWLGLGG